MRARVETFTERLERTVLSPMAKSSNSYKALVLFLLAVMFWGLYAFIVQLNYGLMATGMRDTVMWGLYLVNFVFFIGISHAGTLISAILRVSNATWRTPVTRMAELITVVAISIGALMPIIDLGRPERVWHIIVWGRFQSPLLWDIVSIASYLSGSILYLYLPLIPDFALMRDRFGRGTSNVKRKIYTWLAVGWKGTPEQHHRLEKAIGIMALTIIPIAVSVHTVVSYVFAMTLRPGWDSTAFGIYFVIGAIFSGLASILIVMAIFRKIYHLEEYLTERHFKNLSHLFLVALLFYAYLTIGEFLVPGYKMAIEEKHLLELIMLGQDAGWFWFFVVGGMVVPAILLIFRIGRTIPRILVAAVLVNIAMWIKRFIIVVPSLKVPLMPFEFGTYTPTWVEWSITAAAFAAFVLIFAVFAKIMPLISIWEVAEENEQREHATEGKGK
ncbi:MAG: NrfD/PsrC family molybdoenzyme membrane anchor subunit [Dehalococcoidia bacterium]|nr:NrfD/PsrC family molybdoenzyme membrane anchor subunit [Dehalococcoidia bacterium]MDZ4246118.1 NrfD/PsrC family molybdoenzyme membrane anchor subunit [Dehalococcoidia bacterium]